MDAKLSENSQTIFAFGFRKASQQLLLLLCNGVLKPRFYFDPDRNWQRPGSLH